MWYVRLVLLEEDRDALVATLQRLGIIDLRRGALNLDSDCPRPYASSIYELLGKFDEAVKVLPQRKVTPAKSLTACRLLKEAGRELETVKKVMDLDARRKFLLDQELSIRHSDYLDHRALHRNRKEQLKISSALNSMGAKHYGSLVSLREMLEIEHGRDEAVSMLKTTGHACVMEGWISSKRFLELGNAANAATSGRCSIEKIAVHELPPTYPGGGQNSFAKAFNHVINLYSVPRSDEANPAWLFMLSFPILFGLMVGDVGYGMLSLALGLLIARYTGEDSIVHDMAVIWQLAAAFTILFGIINNQYLGFELGQHISPLLGGFDWKHNISTVISIAIAIGLAQLSAGLIVGFMNNYRKRRFSMAVSKLLLLCMLLSGTAAVAGIMFHAFSSAVSAASAAVALSCIILLFSVKPSQGERIIDLILYPVSYIRIVGFGITSVVIGGVINDMFAPDISAGAGMFAIYLAIFCILHLLNLALSTFEGAIQGVRLNFVEFFDQFYTGGGTMFRPFYYKRVYTGEV